MSREAPRDCEAVAFPGKIHKIAQVQEYARIFIVYPHGYHCIRRLHYISMVKTRMPRRQKRRSLASKDHFARLVREVVPLDPGTSPSGSSSDSKKVPTVATLDYANVLVIERFQAAVESRTFTCQRLEQLIRTSPTYTPAVKSQLIGCLRKDFIQGDKTRRIIEDLRRSDFISILPSEKEIEYMRKDIAESTRILLEGSNELQVIGDRIATHFS